MFVQFFEIRLRISSAKQCAMTESWMRAYCVHWFDLICLHYATGAYSSGHWLRIACYENQTGICNLNFAFNPAARSFIETVRILKDMLLVQNFKVSS